MGDMSEFAVDVGKVGRSGYIYDSIHQWVALSGVSGLAAALYQIYRMHVNDKRDDYTAWPGTVTLGRLLGVPPDRVAVLNRELVDVDAIRIHKEGMPRHNVYTINSTPPDGYQGPVDLAGWYKVNKGSLDDERAALAAKTARSRAKAKGQVGPVTSDPGVQGGTETKPQVSPVTGKSGVLVTPKSGLELNELDLNEVELKPPLPPRDRLSETSAPVGAEPGGGDSSKQETREDDPVRLQAREVLRRLLQNTPEHRRPVNGQRTELVTLTIGALHAGWSPTALERALGEKDLAHVDSVAGALRHRLRQLPPASQRAARTDQCRRHQGQPANNCAPCRGERIAGTVVAPVVTTGAVSREQLRQEAAEKITRGRLKIKARERKTFVTLGA